MNTKVDLHIHSTMSDGTFSVKEILVTARECGIKYLSITDHDTMKGVTEAIEEGMNQGITVIPGIEISTGYKEKDIHVLGYGMDPSNPLLIPIFEYVQKDRKNRNLKIAKKMIRDGISVDLNTITSKEVFGRPHFAKLLMKQGYATSIQDAFEKYLNEGCKYYEPRTYIAIEEAIGIIHKCNGKAILAHPYQYKLNEVEFNKLIKDCVSFGIDGLEAYYTEYSDEQIKKLIEISNINKLIITGGSDFHGENKPNIRLGELFVPIECAKSLMESQNI